MRRTVFFLCFAALGLSFAQPALADALDDKLKPLISEQYAKEFMEKSLKGIHYLNCDGVPCRPTDEFELFNPPLSNDDTRQILVYGIKGALAWWCGLDEERSTVALGDFVQAGGYNARQTALAVEVKEQAATAHKALDIARDLGGQVCLKL